MSHDQIFQSRCTLSWLTLTRYSKQQTNSAVTDESKNAAEKWASYQLDEGDGLTIKKTVIMRTLKPVQGIPKQLQFLRIHAQPELKKLQLHQQQKWFFVP